MRRPAAALAGLALLAAGAAARAETLRRFETELTLAADGSFVVEERLRVDFGAERRHGIFRDVPVAYGRGRAADYRIRLEVLAVTDGMGAPRPFGTSRRGRDLRIRIGDPQRTVTGRQDYVLRYRVERGILWFERHDELYWNATGTGWAMPIEAASARVLLPEALPPDAVDAACYTGPFGSVASDCRVHATPGVVAFETERALGPGEGLSLAVGLPKGVLDEPSRMRRLLQRASDWLSAWMLLPLLALAAMATLWRREGRDPGAADALPVRYEPPEGMTPAEVGTVLDESVDRTDLTATILELAVHGKLRIEEQEGTRFLFLDTKDYVLHRTGDAGDLPPFEAALHARLFQDGDTVRVSSLKNRFYRHLPELRRVLYREVSRDGRWFPASPDRVRKLYGGAGVALLVLGGLGLGGPLGGEAGLGLGLAGAVVLAFSRVMPRRTRRGRRAYEEILGFREFLQRVDADRLERLGGRSAGRFERVLPYAVVLDAADAWAEAFADVYTEPPDWYVGSRHGAFHPRVFVGDVGRSLTTIGQSLASTPSRGSGSSGLGGGGSSGGGFGGGGGGSW